MIAALYVEKNGCYYGLPHVDPWDRDRDARNYSGPWPVVAHPPCEKWSMISMVNHFRWGSPINDDDGCFAAALASVRKYGGVLEHPAESRAFRFHGIPEPVRGAWQKTLDGDWTTEVNQAAYGHRATKKTWLLCSGVTPPSLNWQPVRGSHQIGGFDITLPQLPKRERAASPIPFRDLLISIAQSVNQSRSAP